MKERLRSVLSHSHPASAGCCAFKARRETVLTVSEREPGLNLKHSRRVDVRKRRDCIRRRTNSTNKLPKRRRRDRRVAIYRHTAAEKVSVIEKVEAFEAQQNAGAV